MLTLFQSKFLCPTFGGSLLKKAFRWSLLPAFVISVAFTACKSSNNSSAEKDIGVFGGPTTPDIKKPLNSSPCSQEFAAVCKKGEIDGCFVGKKTHDCVSYDAGTKKDDCRQEYALLCPKGKIDACLTSAGQSHICIKEDKKIGTTTFHLPTQRQGNPRPEDSEMLPCSEEILAICPSGQVDACVLNNRDGRGHTCVTDLATIADNLPCAQEIAAICPDGQIDACLVNPSDTRGHVCVASTSDGFGDCNQEIAAICDEGQIDACFVGGQSHRCIAVNTTANDCNKELAMLCPDGQIDACMIGKKSHACVQDPTPSNNGGASPESVSIPDPCAMEYARVCSKGQIDACLINPNDDRGHLCIQKKISHKKASPCSQEIALVCPKGKVDQCLTNANAKGGHKCVNR
jgi:hypothetical protein